MEDYKIIHFQYLLLEWYKKNKRNFPWRYTYNPYYVLVSELMLQQTSANQVIDVYNNFVAEYSSMEALSKVDYEQVEKYFYSLGLVYRARVLVEISKTMWDLYKGIPNDKNSLMSIKGIGDYICNAILCFGYNKAYAIVDTNVIRVFDKILDYRSRSATPHKDVNIWEFAQSILPKSDYVDYNYALLDFGAALKSNNQLEKEFVYMLNDQI
ncbi:hypothetical protein [Clostridium polynesiense]|uniref:hypothetical protein n=1 Tax=Clostridium polynesiense TaxID=1325933 RepID=UPI00069400D1|nr:hypothetical protein [Clostridium polynesiense]